MEGKMDLATIIAFLVAAGFSYYFVVHHGKTGMKA
jgi:hypothetical protein